VLIIAMVCVAANSTGNPVVSDDCVTAAGILESETTVVAPGPGATQTGIPATPLKPDAVVVGVTPEICTAPETTTVLRTVTIVDTKERVWVCASQTNWAVFDVCPVKVVPGAFAAPGGLAIHTIKPVAVAVGVLAVT
jgi:hypothetical protein